ncbi:hypothetical protein THAOC_22959 [Thalassiosira oceanica]|uniref:Peptidyl-prolyl cis-trans isomerase n=1 Tax=Thalassiosira oceanica TaxID=159749 RepID=K0RT64_THAOC|nr:hypothetical protein THAOC_22959 [Thalassiosira oceanica]|eukprot:EJK57043.1 hypothetical protein THAOC_22959 [Thalassiosira oceanica]
MARRGDSAPRGGGGGGVDSSCQYCFFDLDINNHRSKLALVCILYTAAFVDATDSRYGFSNKDVRKLGGSELSRLNDYMAMDHGGLYWDVAPLAAGFVLQAGDFVMGNGAGGESVFGKKFKDGLLGMGNSGKNSNTSQFYVTLGKTPQCDGKHVIFGEVVSGMETIRAAEEFATSSGEPSVDIRITECGPYIPLSTPSNGYWFDRPDPESFSGITPEFVIKPRVGIIAPNVQVAEKFRNTMGSCAAVTMAKPVNVLQAILDSAWVGRLGTLEASFARV